ncbi:MAG: hypothetical protein IJ593_12440 [Lachnospiraceae bacterium]|nr:hypothetical protein [Lachnospiraceae bacterium]
MDNKAGIEYFKNRIKEKINKVQDQMGKYQYKLAIATIDACQNYEDLKDMAELSMQMEFFEYVKDEINPMLEAMNTDLASIRKLGIGEVPKVNPLDVEVTPSELVDMLDDKDVQSAMDAIYAYQKNTEPIEEKYREDVLNFQLEGSDDDDDDDEYDEQDDDYDIDGFADMFYGDDDEEDEDDDEENEFLDYYTDSEDSDDTENDAESDEYENDDYNIDDFDLSEYEDNESDSDIDNDALDGYIDENDEDDEDLDGYVEFISDDDTAEAEEYGEVSFEDEDDDEDELDGYIEDDEEFVSFEDDAEDNEELDSYFDDESSEESGEVLFDDEDDEEDEELDSYFDDETEDDSDNDIELFDEADDNDELDSYFDDTDESDGEQEDSEFDEDEFDEDDLDDSDDYFSSLENELEENDEDDDYEDDDELDSYLDAYDDSSDSDSSDSDSENEDEFDVDDDELDNYFDSDDDKDSNGDTATSIIKLNDKLNEKRKKSDKIDKDITDLIGTKDKSDKITVDNKNALIHSKDKPLRNSMLNEKTVFMNGTINGNKTQQMFDMFGGFRQSVLKTKDNIKKAKNSEFFNLANNS